MNKKILWYVIWFLSSFCNCLKSSVGVDPVTKQYNLHNALYHNNVQLFNKVVAQGALDVVDVDQMYNLLKTATFRNIDNHIQTTLAAQGIRLYGSGLLLRASQECAVDIVQLLLSAGLSVNVADSNGLTALMYAVKGGLEILVERFIEAGADVNAIDNTGKTALIYGVQEKWLDIVAILINAHADIDRADNDGYTPLMYAVKDNSIEFVNMLIKAGADVNAIDATGKTALMYAVLQNSLDMVETLINAGAHIDVVDTQGANALLYAAINGFFEIEQFLLVARIAKANG